MINEQCVKAYCCEDPSLIENYALAIADTTQTWICHHILGEQHSKQYLKENGVYLNRPACELRFVTRADHQSLHHKGVPRPDLKGVPKSEEHKQAISDALKGVPLSEEHKQKLSDAQKGVPKSEAHKKAISYAKKGVPQPWKYKKVLQFTKSGEFIKEWVSAIEAARELGIARSNICKCCKGERKSAGGYVWRYAS